MENHSQMPFTLLPFLKSKQKKLHKNNNSKEHLSFVSEVNGMLFLSSYWNVK